MHKPENLRFEEIEMMAAPDSDMYAGFKIAAMIGLVVVALT